MQTAMEFLGVPQDSDSSALTRTYRELAKKWHPDKTDRANAEYVFKLILAAYNAAKAGDTGKSFPILKSMQHTFDPGVALPLCKCGWLYENEFMCQSCGSFLPGLAQMPEASFPVRERFWKIARQVCIDRGVSTKPALKAYAQVFCRKPKVLGRNLTE